MSTTKKPAFCISDEVRAVTPHLHVDVGTLGVVTEVDHTITVIFKGGHQRYCYRSEIQLVSINRLPSADRDTTTVEVGYGSHIECYCLDDDNVRLLYTMTNPDQILSHVKQHGQCIQLNGSQELFFDYMNGDVVEFHYQLECMFDFK